MIKSHLLRYIQKNQSNLRTLKFSKFVAAANDGNSTLAIEGNRIIIPSSFTRGPRYMHQMYLDAMSICKYFGFPDLFITFTCNPKCPELTRYFKKYNLKSEGRSDLCCRVFKIKLHSLIDDLTKKNTIYTIEFQKRGFSHAHILLFMDSKHKLLNVEDIDRIIAAEIPDKAEELRLYDIVKDMMIHGPCGKVNRDSPCMQDGKCTNFFPRKHVEKTTVDDQGYPVYRRQENGSYVERKGISCDNRFVVPYNKELLLAFLAFPTQYCCTPVEKLKIHLEGEQPLFYNHGDNVESVLARVHLTKTMFLAWVLINKVKGPRCYNDIKTVNEIILPSYEDACFELGLLDDNKEYIEGLKECSFWASNGYVLHLFAMMLLSGCLSMPKLVWESTTYILSEDALHIVRKMRKNPGQAVRNETLVLIEKYYPKNSSLARWDTMPKPGYVVLNITSSGASLYLPGGRTAFSRFGIPINPDEPFGGKVVVFGGDFWQILPIIPRENRADIVMAALNSSYLWKHCKVLQLTKNMRLFSETDPQEAEEIKQFSDWILDVGDIKINEPNSGETMIDIPKDLLVMKCTDPIEAINSEVYGNTFKDTKDPLLFQEREILCPTNEDVDVINNYMLDRLPNHAPRLRIGTPVMLIRNQDPAKGLCNETRLQITQLDKHILQAKIITGTRTCFSHGQLYVAVSRVKSRKRLKILITDKDRKHQD
ncbi:hypothetical protein N665_0398s0006 [Sinapis alba]|nr:hypothetical protein N665_0398s0006 [Sinapis alba]